MVIYRDGKIKGKDGDKYVNTETGDVFVRNNGNWDKRGQHQKALKGDKKVNKGLPKVS